MAGMTLLKEIQEELRNRAETTAHKCRNKVKPKECPGVYIYIAPCLNPGIINVS